MQLSPQAFGCITNLVQWASTENRDVDLASFRSKSIFSTFRLSGPF